MPWEVGDAWRSLTNKHWALSAQVIASVLGSW
jgi:hypothetical protein